MRLSCDEQDAGFAAWDKLTQEGKQVTVILDGVEVKSVITADDEAGFITRIKFDAEGNICAKDGEDEDDEFEYETLHGEVKLFIT